MTNALRAYLDAHRADDNARNAATFRRIAAHLAANGDRDQHGNSAATYLACAKRLENN